MSPDASRWMLLLTLLLGLYGCKPEIGDECSVSTDCSNAGDRLCDTTQPGGYCTIFNCEPGTCPEEAACVSFKITPSTACPDPQTGGRLRRTFCMRNCSSDGDCRGGYRCININAKDNPWGAKLAEGPGKSGKVCIVPFSGGDVPDAGTAVCEPSKGCGPDTCAGCCDALGLCRGGTEQAACGAAGQACASCGSGQCAASPSSVGGACQSVTDAAADGPADADTDASDGGSDASEGGATDAGDASDAADAGADGG
ncbi:MAG: hypothetical protein KF718_09715 [Polyangiaceae bacterium]|nr:hypothetical protein [Polyangiaceae bacterium]